MGSKFQLPRDIDKDTKFSTRNKHNIYSKPDSVVLKFTIKQRILFYCVALDKEKLSIQNHLIS
jgi:hypothetical protein